MDFFLLYFSALILLTDSKCPYDEGEEEGSDADRLAKLSIPRDTPDYLCKTTPSMEPDMFFFFAYRLFILSATGPSFIYRLLFLFF